MGRNVKADPSINKLSADGDFAKTDGTVCAFPSTLPNFLLNFSLNIAKLQLKQNQKNKGEEEEERGIWLGRPGPSWVYYTDRPGTWDPVSSLRGGRAQDSHTARLQVLSPGQQVTQGLGAHSLILYPASTRATGFLLFFLSFCGRKRGLILIVFLNMNSRSVF